LPRCLSSPPALSLRIATYRLHRRHLPPAACASPLLDMAVALGVVLLEISRGLSWRGGAPLFRGRRYGARSKRSTTAISARLVVNWRSGGDSPILLTVVGQREAVTHGGGRRYADVCGGDVVAATARMVVTRQVGVRTSCEALYTVSQNTKILPRVAPGEYFDENSPPARRGSIYLKY
jgi:hypothetical protein